MGFNSHDVSQGVNQCVFPHVFHHLPSAPPQGSAPEPGAENAPSVGGIESATEEGPSSSRKVKALRWIQGCLHYRFPASIDPFTSESPARYSWP